MSDTPPEALTPEWDTAEFREALDKFFGSAEKKRGRGKLMALLILSLLLFVGGEAFIAGADPNADATGGVGVNLTWVAMLVGTLLFHELGHLAAMRAFGYRDLGIFFIPFFGAAATGKKKDATPVQRAWVLLAGPLPGILVGAAMLPVIFGSGDEQLAMLCWMLLSINLFNLVPGGPLDGGRFLNLVLFSRKPTARAVAQVFGGVVLGVLAWLLESTFLALFAVFTLKAIPEATKNFVSGQRMRETLGDDAVSKTRPSEDELPRAVGIVIEEFSQGQHDVASEPRGLARRLFASWNEADYRPPTWKASIGLLAVYLGAWLIAPLTFVMTVWIKG